jgi:hypothetical protein
MRQCHHFVQSIAVIQQSNFGSPLHLSTSHFLSKNFKASNEKALPSLRKLRIFRTKNISLRSALSLRRSFKRISIFISFAKRIVKSGVSVDVATFSIPALQFQEFALFMFIQLIRNRGTSLIRLVGIFRQETFQKPFCSCQQSSIFNSE